ncbi:MAG: hypothetical protein RI957_881 [Verrucomicrobiota bacterium]|jgi:hypothetical protein
MNPDHSQIMKIDRILYLSAIVVVLSNCSDRLIRVQPYERGNLAGPLMAPDRDPLFKAMTEHAYFSREASFGGGGVGGGGCGCN